jgi:threonine synthase
LEAEWYCPRCGWSGRLSEGYWWRCPRCGSPLRLRYARRWEPRRGVWGVARYSTMLPLEPKVSLGEGGTGLVERRVEDVNVFFKLEFLNPTGSFKDRGTSLAISYASMMGFRSVVEDTSGNTGISVSAYASAAGLKAKIFMPSYAPEGKKTLVRLYGGEIVETPTRGDAAKAVLSEAKRPGVFYVAHTWSPFYIEGAKTISFEVYEQAGIPDVVVAPVGSGGLFLGIYEGFRELVEQGLAEKIPRLVAVQGYSNPPVYRAFYGREPERGGDSSLADGILVPNPPRLSEIVEALRSARGCVVLVDNDAIVDGLKLLASMGFIVEPTSAAAVAGLLEARRQGCIERGEHVLVPLTGSGLKMAGEIYRLIGGGGS